MPIETTWGKIPEKEKPKPKPFREEIEKSYGIKTREELKAKVDLILHKNKIRSYEYEEESFSSSVEPKYFWVIDFLKNAMKYTVEKHWEKMGASVVSQFFGEMSTRRQFLEKRGMEIMATINTVIRTIINLLYDLRELDRRIMVYEHIKSQDSKESEDAEMSLKRVWMDEVDVRKGGASLNNMAQKGLEFITIRDAFLIAKSEKTVDELQLNDRVKRILKMRLQDYEDWKKVSENELHMRKRVERAYLISEVDSLKLYSKWAKPYLKAAQRLQFEDVKLDDPELIQAFDQNFIELKIRAKKEFRLKEFFSKAATPRGFSAPATWSKEKKDAYIKEKFGPPVYGIMDVTFQYRTKPTLVSQTQGGGGAYRSLGKLNIKFESYFLTPEEYKLLDKQEDSEALKFIEGMTQETLEAMQSDIEHYLEEEKDERGKEKPKKKEEKKEESKQKPLLEQFLGDFGAGFNMAGGLFDKAKYTQAMLSARLAVADNAFNLYDIFKKSQGLLSFPYYPEYKTPKAGK